MPSPLGVSLKTPGELFGFSGPCSWLFLFGTPFLRNLGKSSPSMCFVKFTYPPPEEYTSLFLFGHVPFLIFHEHVFPFSWLLFSSKGRAFDAITKRARAHTQKAEGYFSMEDFLGELIKRAWALFVCRDSIAVVSRFPCSVPTGSFSP